MARVGRLSFSDGRDFVHADIKTFSLDVESRIAQALEAAGHEVIRAAEPIWTNTMASTAARRAADARPDLTIFNYAVWADVADSAVRDRVLETVRAAAAVAKLSGSTFGRFGGRPMGMYTAVADT